MRYPRFLVDEVRRLSQEEGLRDKEIAEILGMGYYTVWRIRKLNGIPKANLKMRKDKKYVCKRCGAEYVVRRCERRPRYCEMCRGVIKQEKIEKREREKAERIAARRRKLLMKKRQLLAAGLEEFLERMITLEDKG